MTTPAGSGPVPPPPDTRSDQPYFSRAGLAAGAVSMTSMLPSQIAFGAVFGMLAADKALTAIEAAAMSGLMFAGFAQVVVLQYWPEQFTLAALAGLMVSAFTVNLRFLLMSLTFRTWFGPLPAWQSYPTLLFSTDPGWLKSMRYYEDGGRDVGYFLGGGLFAFVVWCLATMVGHEFSGWLTDPKRFGIDLIVPAFFSALLVPHWKGLRRAVPWAAAGIVALIVQKLGFGYWSIAGGAVAGAIVAGLMPDE